MAEINFHFKTTDSHLHVFVYLHWYISRGHCPSLETCTVYYERTGQYGTQFMTLLKVKTLCGSNIDQTHWGSNPLDNDPTNGDQAYKY